MTWPSDQISTRKKPQRSTAKPLKMHVDWFTSIALLLFGTVVILVLVLMFLPVAAYAVDSVQQITDAMNRNMP